MSSNAAPVRLSIEQREQFARDGYFFIRGALSPPEIAPILAEVDRIFLEWQPARSADEIRVGMEQVGAMERSPAFTRLIDHPRTFPMIVDLLGPYLQLHITSVTVRPPNPDSEGFIHTDGGPGLQEFRPAADSRPFQIKVHYFLTDVLEEDQGNFAVVPGSHRMAPHWEPGSVVPVGTIPGVVQVRAAAGDAAVFPHSLWHGAVWNRSKQTRRTITVGYSQLFARPYDYVTPSPELLARCTPRQRALLGEIIRGTSSSPYYYAPSENAALIRGEA